MGRPRDPRNLKMLKGTFRHDKNPANEPDPSIGVRRNPPGHLNKWAKKYWNEYVDELLACGLVTEADWHSFAQLCDAWGMYMEAREAVYSYYGEDGKRHKRTLAEYMLGRNSQTCLELNTMHKFSEMFKKYSEAFGMTPVARNRIDLAPRSDQVDPMDEMLAGLKGVK